MFTLDQIKTAHSKVKSGADFPAYIQEIKTLGVSHYETYVSDGHTDYYSDNNSKSSSAAKYDAMKISDRANAGQFKSDLLGHQQGKTDYLTFCNDCARSGVEKWKVDLSKMTCTYYDKGQNELLVEHIVTPK